MIIIYHIPYLFATINEPTTWKMSREEVHSEFTNGGTLRGNSRIFGFFYFLLRFVAPLVILLIFVSNLIG